MDREELVGIQTIWWVDYQLAVGFLTGSWKSNMDVWISNQLFGNPTACLSWPRCNGANWDWPTGRPVNHSPLSKSTCQLPFLFAILVICCQDPACLFKGCLCTLLNLEARSNRQKTWIRTSRSQVYCQPFLLRNK